MIARGRIAPLASAIGPWHAPDSLAVILFWVCYSSLIVFFGTAIAKVRIQQRGERIVRKPTGVGVVLVVLEGADDERLQRVGHIA